MSVELSCALTSKRMATDEPWQFGRAVMINLFTRCRLSLFLVLASVVLLPHLTWAAEKIAPKSFSNIDQVVGWVKAKGQCKGSSEVLRTCSVAVDLPNKYDGKDLSPGWVLLGEILAIEIKNESFLKVRIFRTRQFRVSAKDSTATVTIVRTSEFNTGTHGKILKAVTRIELTNYKGDRLFNLSVRLPRPYIVEAIFEDEFYEENTSLLYAGFGLDFWIWELK